MAATFEMIKTEENSIYKFRFGTTKNVARLTERELQRIPYLDALVAHTNDFLTNRNEQGEYVLNSRIPYTWFMAILRSITKDQPFLLFSKLPCRTTVLGMLELCEYLSVDPVPVPLLKNENLTRSRTTEVVNEKKHVRYYQASISEARNTAAEFVIALSKEEYDLTDFRTKHSVFTLIKFILEHGNIFGSHFCHHTLIVARKYCLSSFSRRQQSKLKIRRQKTQNKICSQSRPNDASEALSANPQIAFHWKSSYEPTSIDDTGCVSTTVENTVFSVVGNTNIGSLMHYLQSITEMIMAIGSRHDSNFEFSIFTEQQEISIRPPLLGDSSSFQMILNWYNQYSSLDENPASVNYYNYLIRQERNKKTELSMYGSQFAYRWPERTIFNKFQHGSGPKAKKYR